MSQAKYIRIDLLEPLGDTHPGATPDEALEEFFDFLVNELTNQGIAAHLQIVKEGDEDDE